MENKQSEKSKQIKSLFITYFDGIRDLYGSEVPGNPSTMDMGVCKLVYIESTNTLDVHLRRPGLLIGKQGRTINATEKHLNCKINIIEVNLIEE